MRTALHAEWTKLRTTPGPAWSLLACVVLTAALSALAAATAGCPDPGCVQDIGKVSFTGIQLGQAVVVVLAVLVIGGEYGTGMIQTTLTAIPRRITALTAKAVVLTAVVLVAGAVAVLGCLAAGGLILPGNGFTPLSLSDGPALRAAGGSVLYLALVGLLSLGVATVVRESATAIGLVLGVLYLFPIITSLVADPDWHRRLEKISPMSSGLLIQETLDLGNRVLTPWEGLGVLGLWAAGALLAGGAVLRLRDVSA